VRLAPDREAFVAPAPGGTLLPTPLEEGKHGRVVTYSLDELSGTALLAVVGVCRVELVPLAWRLDPSGHNEDAIIALGCHPTRPRSEVKLDAVPVRTAASGASSSTSGASAPPPAASEEPIPDIWADYLSFREAKRGATASVEEEPPVVV
jgi:hypothetical protein